jgi:hypothetical protein
MKKSQGLLVLGMALVFLFSCGRMEMNDPLASQMTLNMDQASISRVLSGDASSADLNQLLLSYQNSKWNEKNNGSGVLVESGLVVPPVSGQFSVSVFKNDAVVENGLYMKAAGITSLLVSDTRNGPLSIQTLPVYAAGAAVEFFLVSQTATGPVTNDGGLRVTYFEQAMKWQIVFGDGDANCGHGNDADFLDEDNPGNSSPGVSDGSASVPQTAIEVRLIPALVTGADGTRSDEGEGTDPRVDPDTGGVAIVPIVPVEIPVVIDPIGVVDTVDPAEEPLQVVDIEDCLTTYIDYLDTTYYVTSPGAKKLKSPVYTKGKPWNYILHINVVTPNAVFETSQFVVYAIHEYMNTSNPIPGQNPPQCWTGVTLAYGQTTDLTAQFTISTTTSSGWYQTHVIIARKNAAGNLELTVYDEPQVGFIDP